VRARVRDQRKPGHCWQDNELYDVFQPVIGAQGAHVYAVMTRWIFGHRVKVGMGVREIATESGVSRSAAARSILAMEHLGMLRREAGRGSQSSLYELLDLKEAAEALGAQWNPERFSFQLSEARIAFLRTGLRRFFERARCVSVGDTKVDEDSSVCVSVGDARGTPASQNEGVCVPPAGRASSYTTKHKTQEYPPLPLPPAGGEREDHAIASEARRVKLVCGFTARGVERAIEAQLAQCAEREPGVKASEQADVMIARWQEYVSLGEYLRFPWGPRKFFNEGHWATPELWPIDRERLQMARSSSVGVWRG
jgi:hypothetical protein